MRFRNLLIACGIGLHLLNARADAAFMVRLTNDGQSITVTDNLVGDGLSNDAGVVQTAKSVGDYSLVVGIANSKGTIGSAVAPRLQITIGTAIYTPVGVPDPNLIVEVTDTDFDPTQGYLTELGGSTTPFGSANVSAYTSPSNSEFAYTEQVGSTLTGSGLGFTSTGAGQTTLAPNTSISLKAILTSGQSGDVSQFTMSIKAVPEPATLSTTAWLSYVVCVRAIIRRRANQ